MFGALRKVVFYLNKEEEWIINEIIIKEKKTISLPIPLNIKKSEMKFRLGKALTLLYIQFSKLRN